MVRDEELPEITDRTWESVEAEDSFETDEQGEPIRHGASAPDALPGFCRSIGSWDSSEEETDAPRPSMDAEPRGRLARTAPLLCFFMFHILILVLIGIFIGASRIAGLPAQSPSAEVNIVAPIPPDAAATAHSSPEAATPQPGAANTIAAQAALTRSSSAIALPGSAPAAPDPVPVPASAQPAVVEGALPVPAGPPMLAKTAISTPSQIAPDQAPATIPTERDTQRQVLLSRGDAFFGAGDVTSARLFYQRGAEAGDGAAALRLGESFDAAFLERAHLGGVPSDAKKAIFWYLQARDLGNAEAAILLDELARRP